MADGKHYVFRLPFVRDVSVFLFCYNKRSSYDLGFTIEEHFSYILTEKVSYRMDFPAKGAR